MSETTVAEGGPDTVAARYLIPGMHVAQYDKAASSQRVVRVLAVHPQPQSNRVVVMLLRVAGGVVVLERYQPDEQITVATPTQVNEATAEGQREQLADALEDLVRDIRQQKIPLPECARRLGGLNNELTGLTYSRTDPEAEPTASCPAGVACSGRDGKPSPYACPECGHCSIHDGAGCAARTDDGRCGCTGEAS